MERDFGTPRTTTAQSVKDLFLFRNSDQPDTFETVFPPCSVAGPPYNLRAYGGSSLCTAVAAVHKTVRSNYRIFSVQGNFLSPASTLKPLICRVRRLRDTKAFATRAVDVLQKQKDGSERVCLSLLADFQVPKAAHDPEVYKYDARPAFLYSPPDKCVNIEDQFASAIKLKELPGDYHEYYERNYAVFCRSYDRRLAPEGLTYQRMVGHRQHVRTHQDDLDMQDRRSAEWIRTKVDIDCPGGHFAAMAFQMDMPSSVVPIIHSERAEDSDVFGASVEFSLRFFSNDVRPEQWHLKEAKSTVAAEGRTFGETYVWDDQGRTVAHMSQQCVARKGKSNPKGVSAKL